jgi:hypothetical protein
MNDQSQFSSEFDGQLRRLMPDVPVPENLKVRLSNRMVQRERRNLKRHLALVSALAASLMLAVGIGYGWSERRHRVSDEPVYVENAGPQAMLESWKAGLEFDFQPELKFNWKHLVDASSTEYAKDKSAPSLILVNSTTHATAQLLVVPAAGFEVKDWQNTANNRVQKVKFIRDQARPDAVIYVLIYSGSRFEAFLEQPADD